MAATQRTYGKLWQNVLTGAYAVNWTSDTIKCMLLTASYTPNLDTDVFYSDISANEVANGNGYATGGVTLTSMTTTYDAAGHDTQLKSGLNPSWTSATFTWRYGVVYKSTGVGSTSPLLVLFDPGGTEQVTAGTTSITWDATGVFKVTV